MLLELTIENFAIVDRLRLAFESGFIALTGETGAGKSIVVDALGAVLGERVGADVVRDGADTARIEAVFHCSGQARGALAALLDEYGLAQPDDDEQLVLRREITSSGRSVARVNGRSVTAGTLSRFGARLVDIHGQSEHLSLLRPASHLDYLDSFAALLPERAELAASVRELASVRQRLAGLTRDRNERERRIDFLRFQVAEIESAQVQRGEEAALVAERALLGSAERLRELAEAARHDLSGMDDDFGGAASPRGVLDGLRGVVVALGELSRLDPAQEHLRAQVEEQLYILEDAATALRDYRERIEADPVRLVAIEERLAALKDLRRKHGAATLEDLEQFAAGARQELETMEQAGTETTELATREAGLRAELGHRGASLRFKRQAAAARLAAEVEQALAELNMGRARFAVKLDLRDDPDGVEVRDTELNRTRVVAFDDRGVDAVEFSIAANAGESLKPLVRVASGGEMARFMLALKSILARADTTPTLVFDEVDVGVGGRGGQVVGEKLWGLTAGGHQVLCISHLPQVAAFADQHFHISKRELESRTVSTVAPIWAEDRVEELAAMLDGVPVSSAARASAREMLERAAKWKASRTGDEVTASSAAGSRQRASMRGA